MENQKYWLECLEQGLVDEILNHIKSIDTCGIEPGYFFISCIREYFEKELCSKEKFDMASQIYVEKLQIIPCDY